MATGFAALKLTKEFLDGVSEDVHLNDATVVQGNELNTTGALLSDRGSSGSAACRGRTSVVVSVIAFSIERGRPRAPPVRGGRNGARAQAGDARRSCAGNRLGSAGISDGRSGL